MKKVEIVASRSVRLEYLKPEYRSQVPAGWKLPYFPFTNADQPVIFESPENFDEALQVDGKSKIFELYDVQKQVGFNLIVAKSIVDLVTDLSKVPGRAGKAITVKLNVK